MIINSVDFSRAGGVSHFEAAGRAETAVEPEFRVRFDVQGDVEPAEAGGDGWLAGLLLPAMFAGEDLEIRAPVSRRLTRTVNEIQSILQGWYPAVLRKVEIRTPFVVPDRFAQIEEGPAAAFFSGGVDSWFSLQRNLGSRPVMVTVKGFDVPYNDREMWPQIAAINDGIARELGVEFMTVETDLRDHLDPGYSRFQKRYAIDFWGYCMHGACLAAVGLLLQRRFTRVFVPASWPYHRLQPWGSHPLFDALWSVRNLEFIHDGAECCRLGRIRALAHVPLALKHLRVCHSCVPNRYNCCECEKCSRTMLTLHLMGVLSHATAFDRPLDLRALEKLRPSPHVFPLYEDILKEAEAVQDYEVARIIRTMIGTPQDNGQASRHQPWFERKIGGWKSSFAKRLTR